MPREIVGLLLAAGAGRRFGSDKLLHRLPDGTPMAVAAALNLKPACDRLIAVTRPDQADLSELLHGAGCATIVGADAAGGMGHSLAAGVKATPDAAGWVVALADMPFIKTDSHRAVAAALFKGASLAATEYQGRRGHPVGFAREWLPRLLLLTGDQGGRSILAEHQDRLVLCPVDDAGVLVDIDRPGDLSGLRAAG